MTAEERQAVLASLERGSAALHEAVLGVTEEQAARVSGSGKWSILQCAEHVAAVEDFLFSLIAGAQSTDAPAGNAQREAMILARGADRTNRRESPAEALPKGRFATLHEALENFQASRGRTIQFVNENEEELRSKIAMHPLMGPVNAMEILLLMAVHPERHARQIEEVKAALTNGSVNENVGKEASMEIHAPMGKIKSLKEFATHILIVTIGILIAFSLEGARESWREHVAVKETREILLAELTSDQEQLGKDLRQVRECNTQLDKIIAEMPGLAKSPIELNRRVGELRPGFYGLNTTAWESALSSNTLNYMERNERNHYVGAYFGLKAYREIQMSSAFASYNDVATYFPSHRSYATEAEEAEAERKLRVLKNEFWILDHFGQQITPDLQKALDSK